MKQKEIEQNNEAFFKENSKAFVKLPAQLYKMLETAKDKDIGNIKFIPKTKEVFIRYFLVSQPYKHDKTD